MHLVGAHQEGFVHRPVRRGQVIGEGRQRHDGLVLEHQPRAQFQPRLAGARHQLDGGDTVPAQGEKAVIDSHPRQAEDLCEQSTQQFLPAVAWSPFRHKAREIRCRERRTVELAVRCQRQAVHGHQYRRHQVLRQPSAQVLTQVSQQLSGRTESQRVVHQVLQPSADAVRTIYVRVHGGTPVRRGARWLRLARDVLRPGLGKDHRVESVRAVPGPRRQNAATVSRTPVVQRFGIHSCRLFGLAELVDLACLGRAFVPSPALRTVQEQLSPLR